jgi:hypothetical protein
MNEKRALFDQLANSARQSDSESKVRHVDVDAQGRFMDTRSRTLIGDPLKLDRVDFQQSLVMVNFFSLRSQAQVPVMENLAKVVEKLSDRMGRNIFINSVTLSPDEDTELLLEKFAFDLRAPAGWTFVRATRNAAGELVGRMNRLRGYTTPELVFYGRPGGYWGTFPAMSSPEELADRIVSAVPTEKPGILRRAGPAIRGQETRPWSAREA